MHVGFEAAKLEKPVFHVIGARVETRRFSAIDRQILKQVFHLIGAKVETKRLSAVEASFETGFFT